MTRPPPISPLSPSPPLSRPRGHEVDFVLASRRKRPLAIECKWSAGSFDVANLRAFRQQHAEGDNVEASGRPLDRKSTRLNSSHDQISYAVFCLKKKKT